MEKKKIKYWELKEYKKLIEELTYEQTCVLNNLIYDYFQGILEVNNARGVLV